MAETAPEPTNDTDLLAGLTMPVDDDPTAPEVPAEPSPAEPAPEPAAPEAPPIDPPADPVAPAEPAPPEDPPAGTPDHEPPPEPPLARADGADLQAVKDQLAAIERKITDGTFDHDPFSDDAKALSKLNLAKTKLELKQLERSSQLLASQEQQRRADQVWQAQEKQHGRPRAELQKEWSESLAAVQKQFPKADPGYVQGRAEMLYEQRVAAAKATAKPATTAAAVKPVSPAKPAPTRLTSARAPAATAPKLPGKTPEEELAGKHASGLMALV
jgi:hypothetical protein